MGFREGPTRHLHRGEGFYIFSRHLRDIAKLLLVFSVVSLRETDQYPIGTKVRKFNYSTPGGRDVRANLRIILFNVFKRSGVTVR